MLPLGLISQHGIEDDDYFAGAGGLDQALWLARGSEPEGKGFDDRVAAHGGEDDHMKDGPQLIASAEDLGAVLALAALAVSRRDRAQSRSLSAADASQLGDVGQEIGGKHRARSAGSVRCSSPLRARSRMLRSMALVARNSANLRACSGLRVRPLSGKC